MAVGLGRGVWGERGEFGGLYRGPFVDGVWGVWGVWRPVSARSAGAECPAGWFAVESEHGEPGEVHGGGE
jgi:hypothetical protein